MAAKNCDNLEALKNDVDGVLRAEVVETSDSEDWQWADIRIDPQEDVTASEMLSSSMKRHGFEFCGLEMRDGAPVVRVNRKKGGD